MPTPTTTKWGATTTTTDNKSTSWRWLMGLMSMGINGGWWWWVLNDSKRQVMFFSLGHKIKKDNMRLDCLISCRESLERRSKTIYKLVSLVNFFNRAANWRELITYSSELGTILWDDRITLSELAKGILGYLVLFLYVLENYMVIGIFKITLSS